MRTWLRGSASRSHRDCSTAALGPPTHDGGPPARWSHRCPRVRRPQFTDRFWLELFPAFRCAPRYGPNNLPRVPLHCPCPRASPNKLGRRCLPPLTWTACPPPAPVVPPTALQDGKRLPADRGLPTQTSANHRASGKASHSRHRTRRNDRDGRVSAARCELCPGYTGVNKYANKL